MGGMEKTAAFIRGIAPIIKNLISQFPKAFANRGGRNLAKLFGRGVVAPYKDVVTRGNATKTLLNDAEALSRQSNLNLNTYLNKRDIDLLNSTIEKGPTYYKSRNDMVANAINTAKVDPRIDKFEEFYYSPIRWNRLQEGQRHIAYNKSQFEPRRLFLDDVGSISPNIAYHEIGHLDNAGRIARFLQTQAIANGGKSRLAQVLEEARASTNGYIRMRDAGYPYRQAVGAAEGLPIYILPHLPWIVAKAGITTGKYIIPAGAGGYGVYKYIQNNQKK